MFFHVGRNRIEVFDSLDGESAVRAGEAWAALSNDPTVGGRFDKRPASAVEVVNALEGVSHQGLSVNCGGYFLCCTCAWLPAGLKLAR